MNVIDFTDYNDWGHAIHGSTMRDARPPKKGFVGGFRQYLKDKKQKARYRTVMVHSIKCPREGDTLKYKSLRGVIEGEIVHVYSCRDPDDMYTLTFRVVP